jgi:heme a synthase
MQYSRGVKIWLFIGVLMVVIQVVVGGITRLTESGLSITKWEVVSGTLPPLSEERWNQEFDLYKNTPQYREINEGMSISDFKFIYFWEWVHRFWARFMGFVFLIPFLIFILKNHIDVALSKRLGIVVLLAGLAAIFGWIMVASGLIQRPWVNAYKLSIHLAIAFSVFAALWWTYLWSSSSDTSSVHVSSGIRRHLWIFSVLYLLQMLLGGILSGMKAAVVYPSWPSMNGSYFPSVLLDSSQWTVAHIIAYDQHPFMAALIHFLHRNTAYILFFVGLFLSYRLWHFADGNRFIKRASIGITTILSVQVLLGIITVLMSVGKIPVLWGTLHQFFGLMLLAIIVYTFFVLRVQKLKNRTILPLV